MRAVPGHPQAPQEEPRENCAEYTVKAPATERTEIPAQRKLAYAYDSLGRLAQRTLYADEAQSETARVLQTQYSYAPGGHGEGSTTGLVCALAQGGRETVYRYDAVGNLVEEADRGQLSLPDGAGGQMPLTSWEGEVPLTLSLDQVLTKRTYAYDPLGQLVRADSLEQEVTWTYRYDQGGNLLEKKRYAYTTAALDSLTPQESISYSYGDAGWKDKLTAYDGRPISYDEIDNPLSYDGWSYTWKAGRMLDTMHNDSVNARFTYDHTGLRVKKEVDGVETLYTLNGKKITHPRRGNTQMHFYYDAQGRVSIVRYNGVDYGYLHNLQGDVMGLVDMDGEVVVEYSYDPWGAPIGRAGSLESTLGKDNPFRYRGYVWDGETGLYYLRNRYYDPVWGRFLNADTKIGNVGGLLNHILYSYCGNNPGSHVDVDGFEYATIGPGENLLELIQKGSEGILWYCR